MNIAGGLIQLIELMSCVSKVVVKMAQKGLCAWRSRRADRHSIADKLSRTYTAKGVKI